MIDPFHQEAVTGTQLVRAVIENELDAAGQHIHEVECIGVMDRHGARHNRRMAITSCSTEDSFLNVERCGRST